MADIAFLLIVFFMVTTVFQVDRTEVKLPESMIRMDVPRDGGGSAYIVTTDDPNIVKWSGLCWFHRESSNMPAVLCQILRLNVT